MKLSKRAEKLRDELADADSYNQWADKQPDKNNYMHTYIRGFDQGYSAARLEAKVLEEALDTIANESPNMDVETAYRYKALADWIREFAEDALKKYRGEQE